MLRVARCSVIVEVEDITWSTAEDRKVIADGKKLDHAGRFGWRLTVTPSWFGRLLRCRPFSISVTVNPSGYLEHIATGRNAGQYWLKYIERRPVKAAELRAGELEVERLLSE